MSRENAIVALVVYATRTGEGEIHEPKDWQASDLITDLLLCFDPETADVILHRVERDNSADREDRGDEPPAFPPAIDVTAPEPVPLLLPDDAVPGRRPADATGPREAAVLELLAEFRELANQHKASLDKYRDPSGDADEDFYTEYDDARTTVSIEAADFLDAAMGRLEALYPLPPGQKVTFPGADGETFTVVTGQLDDQARNAFTSGQCHAMARALSGVTGWPMAVLISDECSYDPDLCDDSRDDELCACRLEHVVVVRPDGKLVDVNGAHHPGQVPGFEGKQYVALLEGDWEFICRSPHWRRPALAIARTFTAAVLALPDNT